MGIESGLRPEMMEEKTNKVVWDQFEENKQSLQKEHGEILNSFGKSFTPAEAREILHVDQEILNKDAEALEKRRNSAETEVLEAYVNELRNFFSDEDVQSLDSAENDGYKLALLRGMLRDVWLSPALIATIGPNKGKRLIKHVSDASLEYLAADRETRQKAIKRGMAKFALGNTIAQAGDGDLVRGNHYRMDPNGDVPYDASLTFAVKYDFDAEKLLQDIMDFWIKPKSTTGESSDTSLRSGLVREYYYHPELVLRDAKRLGFDEFVQENAPELEDYFVRKINDLGDMQISSLDEISTEVLHERFPGLEDNIKRFKEIIQG